MTNFIGNDISKRDFHTASGADREVARFTNDRKGIREFFSYLKKNDFWPDQTIIGMESTDSYHLLLALMCRKAGYQVNVINSLITKKRNQVTLRRVKNDKKDACLIRHCLMEGAGYPFVETEET